MAKELRVTDKCLKFLAESVDKVHKIQYNIVSLKLMDMDISATCVKLKNKPNNNLRYWIPFEWRNIKCIREKARSSLTEKCLR